MTIDRERTGLPGTGDVRVQVGARSMRWARPRRVVLGRRHPHTTVFGEDFWGISTDQEMSRHWFSIEDVVVEPLLGGDAAPAEVHLRVRCLSTSRSVLVWEGREPVRVQPQASYLAQGDMLFVGDLVDGNIVGARVSVSPDRPTAPEPAAHSTPVAGGATLPPAGIDLSPAVRDVVLARYHRYYRLPPDFDPQPTPWDQVAVGLGLLPRHAVDDRSALRRALKDPQEAVTRLKQRVEALHPGWLPEASETQKTFHDHLRAILEMHRVFEPAELDAFDARYPLAAQSR